MSAAPPPPPQRVKGPRELRLEWLWSQIWAQFNEGQVYAFYMSQADADLQAFEIGLLPNDPVGASDLVFAKSHDRAQRHHFIENLKGRQDEQRKAETLWKAGIDNLAVQSHFILQTLALANGSVVLGTLGYIGREGAGTPPTTFLWVIGFGGCGFLLILVAAHVGTTLMQKPLNDLLTLTKLYISQIQIQTLASGITHDVKITRRWTHSLGYASAACLIASLVIGVIGLNDANSGIPQMKPHAVTAPLLSTKKPDAAPAPLSATKKLAAPPASNSGPRPKK